MIYLFLGGAIIILICIIIGLSRKIKTVRDKNTIEEKERIERILIKEKKELEQLRQKNLEVSHSIESALNQKQKIESYISQDIEKLKEEKLKSLDYLLSHKKIEKETELEKEFSQRANALENKFKQRDKELETLALDKENEFYNKLCEFSEKSLECADTYTEFSKQLEDLQQRVQASQDEIARRIKIEQQRDFYRVCLSEETIEDLKTLESIRPSLKNQTLFNKFIYDNYISAPAREMVKRVLNGAAPCGIYKITAPDGRAYIGKSTNIKDRWIGHLKTAYNVGTISHSTLHTELKKLGIENFTWELLEEVPKDVLGEREKYWIDFYKTTEIGLNQRKG